MLQSRGFFFLALAFLWGCSHGMTQKEYQAHYWNELDKKTEPMATESSSDRQMEMTQVLLQPGMRSVARNCTMRSNPTHSSRKLTVVPAGRKVWTVDAGSPWFKVFRKKGTAYMAKSCFADDYAISY